VDLEVARLLSKVYAFPEEGHAIMDFPFVPFVATLALGSQPSQRGYKVAGQEEARESRQRGRKGVSQEEARESHHIFPKV
jgi:hypothetical protein